jgi:hypothetical protein
MQKSPRVFTNGMFKNYHPQNQPPNTYRHAINIESINTEGNIMSIINEDGLKHELILGYDIDLQFKLSASGTGLQVNPTNFSLVGKTVLNNEIIVLLTKDQNTNLSGPNLLESEIGVVSYNSNGQLVYKTLLNDNLNFIVGPNNALVQTFTTPGSFVLNFKVNRPIDIVARKLYNGHRIIYLTDYHNIPRAIDLDNDSASIPYNPSTFNSTTSLFLSSLITNPTNPIVNDSGGIIETGAYMFTARLLTNTLAAGSFGFISNPIYVTDNTGVNTQNDLNYDGAPVATPTAKSITITIEDIDPVYQFIDLVVVRYSGQTNAVISEVVKRVAISGSTMTFTYTGNESVIEIISDGDIIKKPVDYNKAKCIEQKDGVLFLSNLESDPTLDDWVKAVKDLKINYHIKEIDANSGSLADQGLDSYKGTTASFEYKGYQRGEVVSLAFVPVYKSGAIGAAYHIPGDFVAPSVQYGSISNSVAPANPITKRVGTFYQNSNVYSNQSGYTIGGKVRHHVMPTISQEPTYVVVNGSLKYRVLGLEVDATSLNVAIANNQTLFDKISGFIIVRQQRDSNETQNKRIAAQGIINRLIKYNIGTMTSIRGEASPGGFSSNSLLPNGGYWTSGNNLWATNPKDRSPDGIPGTGVAQDFYDLSYLLGNTEILWGGKTAPRYGRRWNQINLNDNLGYEANKFGFFSPDFILNGKDFIDPTLLYLENVAYIKGTPEKLRFDNTKLKLASNATEIAASAAALIAFNLAGGIISAPFSIVAALGAYYGSLFAVASTKVLEAFKLNTKCDYTGGMTPGSNTVYTIEASQNLFTIPNNVGGFVQQFPTILGAEPLWGYENNGYFLLKTNNNVSINDIGTHDGTITFDNDNQWNMFGVGNGEGYAKEDFIPNSNHYRGLFNILRDIPDQYGDYTQAEYVKAAYIKSKQNNQPYTPVDLRFFGGDTYLGYFATTNTGKLRYDLAVTRLDNLAGIVNFPDTNIRWEGEDSKPSGRANEGDGGELRTLMGFVVESTKNVLYRHNIQGGLTYWPKEYNPASPKQGRYVVLDQPTYLGQTPYYNKQYSADNSILKFFPPSIIANQSTANNFECRTIYSTPDSVDGVTDNYRIFPLLNYHDVPKNKGEIWDTFVYNSILYLHTPKTLWRTFVNDTNALVSTDSINLQLGTNGIFQRPSEEVFTDLGGYAGSLSQWSNCHTPFGYIWLDTNQGKLFKLGSGIEEISDKGLTAYFSKIGQDYIQSTNSNGSLDNPMWDTPHNYGVLLGYDYKTKVLFLTRKLWKSDPNRNPDNSEHYTLTYSLNEQKFISFHDYYPDAYLSVGENLYVVKNPNAPYINSINTNYSDLYKIRSYKKGVYFRQHPTQNLYIESTNNSKIEIVLNDSPLLTKILDSLSLDHYTKNRNGTNVVNTFSKIQASSDVNQSANANIIFQSAFNPVLPSNSVLFRYLESQYNIVIPREAVTSARIRGKYFIIVLEFDNTNDYEIVFNAISANYRISVR